MATAARYILQSLVCTSYGPSIFDAIGCQAITGLFDDPGDLTHGLSLQSCLAMEPTVSSLLNAAKGSSADLQVVPGGKFRKSPQSQIAPVQRTSDAKKPSKWKRSRPPSQLPSSMFKPRPTFHATSSYISHGSRLSHLSIVKDQSHRVLGTLSIIGLCYFSVSGGPIGSESVMASGGPLVGIIMMVLFPFIWSIPIALITAELSTAYPEDGGYTVWVLEAFGPFWGFQTGYWAWVSGVVDNALYPALAVSTFTDAYGEFGTPLTRYLVKAAIAAVLTLPNLLGVRMIGTGMVVMSVFVMAPFLVMSIWGMVAGNHWEQLGEIRRSDIVYDGDNNVISMSGSVDIDWSGLINTLFWNYNGAVAMSSFGGEVANPGRTYPRAMLVSAVLIALTYLLPLVGSTVKNSPSWTTWDDGSFSSISRAIGGEFLVTWIVIATFVSNAGQFIAELFCDSFQLLGMAECGLAPAFFKARNKRFDTPHNSILASFVIILVLIKFDFDVIQSMTNALSAFYELLIIFAFIKLRYSHKHVHRPYKVPGSLPLLCAGLLVPVVLLGYIAIDVFFTLVPGILVAVFTIIGVVYALWRNFSAAQLHALRFEDV